MALSRCHQCGQLTTTAGVSCPECGAPPDSATGRRRHGPLAWIAATVLLGLALAWLVSLTLGVAPRMPASLARLAPRSEESELWSRCRREMETRLAAPPRARWPERADDTGLTAGGQRAWVKGHVSIPDASGALVRTEFICDLQRVDRSWAVVGVLHSDAGPVPSTGPVRRSP